VKPPPTGGSSQSRGTSRSGHSSISTVRPERAGGAGPDRPAMNDRRSSPSLKLTRGRGPTPRPARPASSAATWPGPFSSCSSSRSLCASSENPFHRLDSLAGRSWSEKALAAHGRSYWWPSFVLLCDPAGPRHPPIRCRLHPDYPRYAVGPRGHGRRLPSVAEAPYAATVVTAARPPTRERRGGAVCGSSLGRIGVDICGAIMSSADPPPSLHGKVERPAERQWLPDLESFEVQRARPVFFGRALLQQPGVSA
jgi:hypothetical protein